MSASIKSIYIEDFQSHAKTKINLAGPGGVTIIVGPTDSGKTAIVRGLRWLFYNVPQGTDFIKVGKHTATVALELSNGIKVVRERSKSANRYRIAKPGSSPITLEGFRNSVPVEIQELTGVRNVAIGDMELALNLSEQLDGPFLGQKQMSGPARAKILGKLAGTEEVDQAQKTLGTDLFRASQEEKRLLSELEVLDAKIREYDYLPTLAERITNLEALLQTIRESQQRLGLLENASQKLAGIHAQRVQALAVLTRWKSLREAEFCVVVAEGDIQRANALAGHRAALNRIATNHEAWTQLLERWSNLPVAQHLVTEADSAEGRLQILRSVAETLAATRSGLAKVNATLTRWAKLPEASNFVAEVSANISRLRVLVDLKVRYDAIEEQVQHGIEVCVRWSGLDAAIQKTKEIAGTSERLAMLSQIASKLTSVCEAKVTVENALAQHTKALADARKQYIDTLISLGKCPLCGSQVDLNTIKEVA